MQGAGAERSTLTDLERRLERFMDADSARWLELKHTLDERQRIDDYRHLENTSKMDCLALEARRFMKTYAETLEDLKKRNAAWEAIWRDVRKAAIEKGVLAFMAALLVALGAGLLVLLKAKLS